MRSQTVRFAFLLALVLTAASARAAPANAVLEGPLSVNGASIVNPIGRVVLLRGVNYPGYEIAPFPFSHSESAYELFARAGFNVVRLPISWTNLEPFPDTFQESYLEFYVDRDIRWAKKYGLYVVLDMHQLDWGPKFGGSGVPYWAVDQYPPTDEGMRQAVSDFWNQTDLQDHLVNVWTRIAQRYANETTIAGYDLLNEPWIYTSIIPSLNASYVNNFYLRVINSIRTVDPSHIIFLEPSNMYPSDFPIKDNVVWSPHFYALSFESSYDQYDVGLLEEDVAEKYQKFVVEMGSPMWIGEFGAFMEDASFHDWLQDAVSAFKKYEVGWAWWAFYGRDLIIPNSLHIRWANERAAPETETPGIAVYLDSIITFAVIVEVAIVGILFFSLLPKGGKRRTVTKRRVRGRNLSNAFRKP